MDSCEQLSFRETQGAGASFLDSLSKITGKKWKIKGGDDIRDKTGAASRLTSVRPGSFQK
jgi:hypothetical protein